MLEDNKKVTKIKPKNKYTKDIRLPDYLEPTEDCIKMFGLWETTYKLNLKGQCYVSVEPSGIIRSGFTVEFFLRFREYFSRVTYKIPPNGN